MGSPGRRRADTAERTSPIVPLCCLILALAAPAPAAGGEVPGEGEDPESAAARADGASSQEPEEDGPVRAVGQVTATATRAERDVLDVPGHVTVIGREQIERSGARSLPDLLRRQEGLFLTSNTTNPAGVQVESRGFANGAGNGSSLLVRVNGRRVNEADSSVADWALVELDEVESVEIVRGPVSALYGDNAVGGVIDIRTRPSEGPPRATVRTRIGRYDARQASLDAAATVGPVTGSFFANGRWTDGYRHGADFDSEDFAGNLQLQLGERALIGVGGGRYHDERGFPGALTRDERDTLGRRARDPESAGTGSEVESRFVEGWLDAVLAEDVLLRIQPHYRWRDDAATAVFDFGAGTGTDVRDKSSLGVDTHLQVDVPICGLRNRLIVGFDFLRDETDRRDALDSAFFSSLQDSDNEKNVYGVFLQEELNLLDTLILSAGVRYDRAEYDLAVVDLLDPTNREAADPDYDIWSPRAALTWRFLPVASVYFSYSRGFRLPNFDENAPALFGNDPIPDLEPQISDSFELGGTWSDDRVEASLALYWMRVKDEIILNPLLNCFPGFGCFGQNDNFDRVRHRGVELGLSVQVASWLTAYANYSFEDVVVTEEDVQGVEGSRIPITPRHRGNLGLVARFPHDVEFTAHALIVGERIVANDFDRQARRLDPYATLDLVLAWRPTFGEHLDGSLTLALRNVNSENYDGLAVRSISDPTRVGFYPAAKLTWEVGLVLTARM